MQSTVLISYAGWRERKPRQENEYRAKSDGDPARPPISHLSQHQQISRDAFSNIVKTDSVVAQHRCMGKTAPDSGLRSHTISMQ